MKIGSFGFFGSGRLRALERGMADIRQTLIALAAQTSLAAENARSLAELSDRVAALDGATNFDREALSQISDAARTSNMQAKEQAEEIVRLRMAIQRLERQLNDDAEEARKVATGLLQRIENATAPRPEKSRFPEA